MAQKKKSNLKYFIIGFLLVGIIGTFFKKEEKKVEKATVTRVDNTCDYSSVEINAYEVGTDKLISEKTVNGCFSSDIVDSTLNLVEITNKENSIKISYYIENDPNILRFLNIKIGDDPSSEWRANKGHDLFINKKGDDLYFIFGDRKVSKIKGTITFRK